MAFQDPFRFSFKPNATQWYFWSNGSIGISNTARYMNAPKGWRETETGWKRSLDSRGLIRGITMPYEFVSFSATLLRTVYYNGSIASKVYFLIERLNMDTMAYEDFFSGEIDLSTWANGVLYNDGSQAVSATVIEGGVAAMLDSAGSTKYAIPLNPSDCDYIKMDGLRLRGTYNWLAPATGSTAFSSVNMFMPMDLATTVEGSYPIATNRNTDRVNAGASTSGSFSGTSAQMDAAYANYLLEAGQTMDLVVNVYYPNFYYSNTSISADIRLKMEVLVVPGGATSPFNFSQRHTLYIDPNTLAAGANRNLTNINVSSSKFTVNEGDRIYVVHHFLTSGTPFSGDFNYGEGAVHIYADFRMATTVAASYKLHTLIEKLLTAITGQTGLLQSSYLTNANARYQYMNPYNVRLTCGDALRMLTTNPAGVSVTPTIKISWADLLRYLKYAHGCGMDIREGKVVIERSEYFFNSSAIIEDVGDVGSFVDTPAREFMATAFQYGYGLKDYDKLNGKDEPNGVATWRGPLTPLTNTEDCTVPIRTDPYGVEEVRANLSGKRTIDDSSDNDTFAIETENYTVGTTVNGISYSTFPLYRPQNSNTQPAQTGLLFPDTMFNLTMLPILNLKRNGGWIRSMHWGVPGAVLRFQTTDRNPYIKINLGNGVIDANADISVDTLNPPFFKPYLLNPKAVLRTAFLQAMKTKPSGCIKFSENGHTYKGFPVKVGVKGVEDNSYELSLLCTVDTDMLPRIV